MSISERNNELIYQHEILRAKLKIRDHYLATVVREIYENSGQILSLVRVQLAITGRKVTEDVKSELEDSGDLVGRVICDLRELSRIFYPEKEILSEFGLINALKRELRIDLNDYHSKTIQVEGSPCALPPQSGIIFFQVILEITGFIKHHQRGDSLVMEIVYTNVSVHVNMEYSGEPINLNLQQGIKDEGSELTQLSLEEKINLIGGELFTESRSDQKNRIAVSLMLEQ